jgi:serine protease AprX
MATPLVAGGAAVVIQFLKAKNPSSTPSAALVKAVLINGADSLKGQYTPSELGATPNRNEGFGRVNLQASVDGRADSHILGMWDEGPTLEVGQTSSFDVDLPNAMSLVKVTLVWTDPAGEGLQNDLDLVVTTSNGVTALGNAQPGNIDDPTDHEAKHRGRDE